MKGVPKAPVKVEETAQVLSPLQKFISTLKKCNNEEICCLVMTLFLFVFSLVFLYKFRNKSDVKKSDPKNDKLEDKERDCKNKVSNSTDDEKNDSSEGQDVSEEDLPWLLQKAPSESSLNGDKKVWTEDKHSECSLSDKSQESVKVKQTVNGCGDSNLSKSGKIMMADQDSVYNDD